MPGCDYSLAEVPSFSNPAEDEVHLVIGGVLVSVAEALEAHDILAQSSGLMVRQPLAKRGNPLALCDYHGEAAPYRDAHFIELTPQRKWRRGAAGRPATKQAFMHALRERTAAAMLDAPLLAAMPLLTEACDAMRTDVSYVAAISRLAVSVLSRQHHWKLRAELRAAQQDAISQCRQSSFTCGLETACGTGRCRFATGVFTEITALAEPGKTARPANHSGGPFSSDTALAELARLRPFKVA